MKTDLQMTKPELKQILGKLYGLEVKSVDTTILMGKIKKTLFRSKFIFIKGRYRKKDEKKAYVKLDTEVNSFFQKVERNLN